MYRKFLVVLFGCLMFTNVAKSAPSSAGEMEIKIKAFEDKAIYAKTKIVQLKNVKASEIEPFIKLRLSTYGAVQVNDISNEIIITDMEPKLSDLARLAKQFDKKGVKEFVRLETQTLFPKYVLPSKLDSIISKNLSPEGSFQTDDDLNAIMITDVQSKIERIKEVLSAIDIPQKQVLLKGEILIVESEWLDKAGSNILSEIGNWEIAANAEKLDLVSGALDVTSRGTLNIDINSMLELGIQEGKVNISSFPTLVVQNNKRGTAMIFNADYPINFSLIPHIGEEDFVNMDIQLSTGNITYRQSSTNQQSGNDSRQTQYNTNGGETRRTYDEDNGEHYSNYGYNNMSGSSQQNYNNQSNSMDRMFSSEEGIRTSIVVKNNTTFAIGNIEFLENRTVTKQLPILGSIPIAGWLFKHRENITTKKKLVVLLTPHILKLGEMPNIETLCTRKSIPYKHKTCIPRERRMERHYPVPQGITVPLEDKE
jgi:type II secretory pathway component GspD/PulD (secretin)